MATERTTVMCGVMTKFGGRKVKLVTDLPASKQWKAIVDWFEASKQWGEIKQDDSQLAFSEVSTITLYIYRSQDNGMTKKDEDAVKKLIAMGATRAKKEDSLGDTKSGWWMDTVFLAPSNMAKLALQVLEGC